MNKRQAKKQFKKKYGVNPNQYANELSEALKNLDMEAITKSVCEGIKRTVEEFADFMEKAPQLIADALEEVIAKMNEYNEGRENGTITITGEKVLLDMWDDTKPSQTPCDTREEEQ